MHVATHGGGIVLMVQQTECRETTGGPSWAHPRRCCAPV